MSSREGSSAVLIEYEGHFPDLDRCISAVQMIWADAADERSRMGDRLGLSLEHFPFKLDMRQGASPEAVRLLVFAGHTGIAMAGSVLMDIWKEIVLPRLKRRFGADVKPVPGKE